MNPNTQMACPWPSVTVTGELSRASSEWVLGNGAGAYASSTIAQLNTRRYHGLLVVPVSGLVDRYVILSHLDVSVSVQGRQYELATHQFPGVPPTEGYRYIESFHQDPLPRTVFRLGEGLLQQTIALDPGNRTLTVRHVWQGSSEVTLTVRPLLAMRKVHDLMKRHGAMRQLVNMRHRQVSVRPVADLPTVTFLHEGSFVGSPDWWYRFELLAESERGLPFQEDLWTPGLFRFTASPGQPVLLTCTLESPDHVVPEQVVERSARYVESFDPGPNRSIAVRKLSVASHAFRSDLSEPPSMVAGYPWFGGWGRFVVMAIPGLFLVQGHVEQAKRLLRGLFGFFSEGLVPCELNEHAMDDAPRSLEASLRLFPLALQMRDRLPQGDLFVQQEFLPRLRALMARIRDEDIRGLRLSSDGFLVVEDLRRLPTWMNARVGDEAVTPRPGAAVEIQGYWARALASFHRLCEEGSDERLRAWVQRTYEKVLASFSKKFWCEDIQYTFDFVDMQGRPVDETSRWIRPNGLLALAACPELFTAQQAQAVLDTVERHLMTPVGIRTLDPRCHAYRGANRGPLNELDRSYHQGSVWPFLVGAYATAGNVLWKGEPSWKRRLRRLVDSIIDNTSGIGQVPELVDGDFPHRPSGCFAYAPSVGELLRVLVEVLNE